MTYPESGTIDFTGAIPEKGEVDIPVDLGDDASKANVAHWSFTVNGQPDRRALVFDGTKFKLMPKGLCIIVK